MRSPGLPGGDAVCRITLFPLFSVFWFCFQGCLFFFFLFGFLFECLNYFSFGTF